ncbi:MAG TPA: efflux RND transporter periplasmic adaptor subunit [Bacteroidales bacterium]|nr:efflux RND transporter periplasmic adaptor subunit [Bacteroidales bacterium]
MKKFFKIFLLVCLGLLIIGTFVFLYNKSKPVVTKYELVSVTRGSIEKKAVATGKVEARNEIMIKPQISGIISELCKEAGEKVSKGEIIAKIKVIPDMGSLNAAESRVRVARINLSQANKDFSRQKELYGKNVISREEFEKATVSLNATKEECEAAENNLEITKTGMSLKTGESSNTLIRSTIDGMILDIPVKVGNSVIQSNSFNDGTTIATVANMKDMLFVGKVDETEVGRIKEGMPLMLSIGALNDRKFEAKLEHISPKGTEESGAILFEIKAAAKIPSDVFVRAGYSANAEIVLNSAKNVLTIPESVIEFNKDTANVYVLDPKIKDVQTFVKKRIVTGLSDGINIEVVRGLKGNEKLKGAAIDPKAKKDK